MEPLNVVTVESSPTVMDQWWNDEELTPAEQTQVNNVWSTFFVDLENAQEQAATPVTPTDSPIHEHP